MSEQSCVDPFKRIAGIYSNLVDRFGHDPKACDYGRAESQRIRFQALSEVAPLQGKRLLDVGCGFADFAEYLREHVGTVEYTGIDLSPRMIEEGRAIRPNLDLRVCNVLDLKEEMYDVVVANGIFLFLGDEAERLMREIIRTLYDRARVAVAFTSLSTWASSRDAGEFYADPLEIAAFCRTVTPWIVLRHDYLPHDFMIYMYRRQTA